MNLTILALARIFWTSYFKLHHLQDWLYVVLPQKYGAIASSTGVSTIIVPFGNRNTTSEEP